MSADLQPAVPLPNVQLATLYQDDLALAQRIRAGDEAAKDEFAARFSPLYYQCASLSGLASEDAEDVAQQALLLAYDRLQRGLFQGRSTLKTWGYHIIRGQIIEQWNRRRQREHHEVRLDQTTGNDSAEADNMLPELTSKMSWEAFEQWLDVIQALRKLSEQERTILLLNRTERRSVRELSELLELREAEVRRILYAAQERLRRQLSSYHSPPHCQPPQACPALLPVVVPSPNTETAHISQRAQARQVGAMGSLQGMFTDCQGWLFSCWKVVAGYFVGGPSDYWGAIAMEAQR